MNCSRKLLPLLAALILSTPLSAQTYQPPKGPEYDAIVKEYVAAMQTSELAGIRAKLPAMEKAYAGHPYTLYFQAFCNHMSGKDVPAALKGYSDAIRMMPDFSDPYPMRASIFADKGMYDRAVADMDMAIKIEGKEAGASWYSDRADYKLLAGDAAAAFNDFKTAVELAPAQARFYRGLVNTSFKMGQPEVALPILTGALSGAQAGSGDIRTVYADLLLRQQKFTEADEQYRKALATAGFKPTAKDYNSAGIIAYKLKDYPRAASLLDKAIAVDGKDAEIICNRASVAIDQKAWEDVYSYAQKALGVAPESPMANMMMAVGVKRTGRGDALAAEYEAKAKRLDAAGR